MESLAVIVAMILMSIILVDIAAVGLSFTRFRWLSVTLAFVAIFAGTWLMASMRSVSVLGLISMACGLFAIARASGD